MGRELITDEHDIKLLKTLHKQGFSFKAMTNFFVGLTEKQLSHQARKLGLGRRVELNWDSNQRLEVVQRYGGVGKEDIGEIARSLGRTEQSIRIEVTRIRDRLANIVASNDPSREGGQTIYNWSRSRNLDFTRLLLNGESVEEIARHFDCNTWSVLNKIEKIRLGLYRRGEQ